MKTEEIKKIVREGYAEKVKGSCSCGEPTASCWGPPEADVISLENGYTPEDLNSVPEGSNLGLGCGNPVALASLKEGEVVLDLGSGAGFDAFLAANKVGKTGSVIGVDMTPEMLETAKENAQKGGYKNVEFRLGDIESLPVDDNTVDVIISNCVINLSPDKPSVFKEAYRVLKPGGRLMVSDIVLLRELPESLKNSAQAYVACVAGACKQSDYLKMIKDSGFNSVKTVNTEELKQARETGQVIFSIKVQAIKP